MKVNKIALIAGAFALVIMGMVLGAFGWNSYFVSKLETPRSAYAVLNADELYAGRHMKQLYGELGASTGTEIGVLERPLCYGNVRVLGLVEVKSCLDALTIALLHLKVDPQHVERESQSPSGFTDAQLEESGCPINLLPIVNSPDKAAATATVLDCREAVRAQFWRLSGRPI